MKKVLIITYYWPPSGGAGVQRWVKFVKYLDRFGYDPIVLTVDPKYATYPQIDESLFKDIPENIKVYHTKSFELYSLYKKVSTNKEIPFGGFANTKELDFKEKILRFVRGNFFLPDPRRGWNKFAYKKAINIIDENKIDYLITTSPPHSTQLIGLKIKKRRSIKWIADLRDPWTDIYYYKDLYPTKLATFFNENYEKIILKSCNKVITVSDELKRLYASKSTNLEDKIEVIPNGFDLDDFVFHKNTNESNQFVYISYVGTISKEYNIHGFIEAIKLLTKNIQSALKIRFIGKIANEFVEHFKQAGLSNNIEIIGYVEHHAAINFMFSSDILLLIIPDVKKNEGILTGKLFEYLATNKPILFLGPVNGDAAKIIREIQAGSIYSYNDTASISDFLREYVEHRDVVNAENEIKNNALKYSRENLTRKLLKILENS